MLQGKSPLAVVLTGKSIWVKLSLQGPVVPGEFRQILLKGVRDVQSVEVVSLRPWWLECFAGCAYCLGGFAFFATLPALHQSIRYFWRRRITRSVSIGNGHSSKP